MATENEDLAEQYGVLGKKLDGFMEAHDTFVEQNAGEHTAIHARLDDFHQAHRKLLHVLIGGLVSLLIAVVIGNRLTDSALRDMTNNDVEMNTTQDAVLGRLDSLEEDVEAVDDKSERRMNNHESTRHNGE